MESAILRTERRLGRTPEEAEIAAALALDVEEYRKKMAEVEALNIGELEFFRDENDSPSLLRYAVSPEEDSPAVTLERAELERLISNSIDRIPKVERTVLSLYFYEELTLREIAAVMGVHLSRVSQNKTQAILRLRAALGERWPGVRR
jgi:RNA polymerase sigma factor for flagellar operon FliA